MKYNQSSNIEVSTVLVTTILQKYYQYQYIKTLTNMQECILYPFSAGRAYNRPL